MIPLNSIRIQWDQFEMLATGRSDMHCKIKESLLIRDLKPTLNENVVECQSILLVPSPYNELYFFKFKFICNRKIITSDGVCCNTKR